MDEFGYLIKESEEAFFQKAAEGIAKEAKIFQSLVRKIRKKPIGATGKATGEELAAAAAKKAPKMGESQLKQLRGEAGLSKFKETSEKELERIFGKKQLASIRKMLSTFDTGFGHGGKTASYERANKLANIVLDSIENGLQKEAAERAFNVPESADELSVCIAATADYAPFGMHAAAYDYFDSLEKIGVDLESAPLLMNHIYADVLNTDALILASLEKTAGNNKPIDEIYEYVLTKLAQIGGIAEAATKPGLLKRLLGWGKSTGEAAASKLYRGIREPRRLERAAKAVERGGQKVIGKAQMARGEGAGQFWKSRKKIHAAKARSLRRQRAGVAGLSPKLESKLSKKIEKAESKLREASKKRVAARARYERGAERAGVPYKERARTMSVPNVAFARKPTKAPKAPGPQKTPAQAKGEAAKAATPPSAKEEEVFKAYRALGETGKPPKGYYKWKKSQGGGGKPKTEKRRPERAEREASPTAAPPPAPSAPREEVNRVLSDKATESPGTFGEIYRKWKDGGWAALADQEKRKVYLGAAGLFVGQRVVMDKPII